MTLSLGQSYDWCRGVARSRARNFYFSFILLPKPQRDAMCAIYAFMRHCDDLSDDPRVAPEAARDSLHRWRTELDAALHGELGDHPLWPAFHDAVNRFHIPPSYFHVMLDGVVSDLDRRQIATFDELYGYCYQVASIVGMTIVHIFGFHDPEALPLAERCGIAFQLTNIIRDVREDAANGRVYLPSEDLNRHGVSRDQLQVGAASPEFLELMRFEAGRAEAYYRESLPLVGMIDPRSRSSLLALIEIYWSLLRRIEDSGFDVLSRRIRLPAWRKSLIVLRGALGLNGTAALRMASRSRR